jgi:hypothetical protein
MAQLRSRLIPTIVYGGLAVGVMDAIAATTHAAILGVSPVRVWQYVASSLLGPASYEGGGRTVAIGLLIHFGIAFGVATGYLILTRLTPAVLDHPVLAGFAFGIAAYFAMAYLFVPMTSVRPQPFSWYGLVSGIIIHIFFVGLPIALVARRFSVSGKSDL